MDVNKLCVLTAILSEPHLVVDCGDVGQKLYLPEKDLFVFFLITEQQYVLSAKNVQTDIINCSIKTTGIIWRKLRKQKLTIYIT
jgi:hypothetical protein